MVGKFLGLISTVIVQIALMVVVWIIVVKIQGGSPTGGMALAILLIICEAILVTAMSLFFTSFTSPFLSGLFCMGIFVAGRNIEIITQLAKRPSVEWMAPLLGGVEVVIPNFYLFFPSGKVVESSWASIHGQFVSNGYVFSTVGYGLAYTAFFLILSIILINRRDFI